MERRRRYTLKRRAERQEQTRARIVDAAVELHETLGARETTITAVAERAGVQRLTVYRHFPDEVALLGACSARYAEDHPLPAPSDWEGAGDPAERTRLALEAVYRFFRDTERMTSRSYRDAPVVPALRKVMNAIDTGLDAIRDDLVEAWRPAARSSSALRAAAGLAVRFSTWQALEREGLPDREKVALAADWLARLAGRPPRARRRRAATARVGKARAAGR